MEIGMIIGSHPRHIWYANEINKIFPVSWAVVHDRGNMPSKTRHDSVRISTELRYFGTPFPKMPVAEEPGKADLILIFGSGLLEPKPNMINMHLGLCPWYRGSAANFWAWYMKEPWNVGVTFHQIDEGIDTGPVLHQCTPGKDTYSYYSLMNSAIVKGSYDMIKLLKKWPKWKLKEQPAVGRTYLSKDLKDHHLEETDYSVRISKEADLFWTQTK